METLLNILGNIGFDWKVALANLANFLIIFWLLNKFIFSKVREVLKKRKERIEESILDAEKAKTALLMADNEKEDILKQARMEAGLVAEQAFKKAKQTVELSVKNAQKEADKTVKDAEKLIEKKKIDAEKELQKKTVDMVVTGLQKVLESEMTPAIQEKVIKRITA